MQQQGTGRQRHSVGHSCNDVARDEGQVLSQSRLATCTFVWLLQLHLCTLIGTCAHAPHEVTAPHTAACSSCTSCCCSPVEGCDLWHCGHGVLELLEHWVCVQDVQGEACRSTQQQSNTPILRTPADGRAAAHWSTAVAANLWPLLMLGRITRQLKCPMVTALATI